jgi:hypothetical protein
VRPSSVRQDRSQIESTSTGAANESSDPPDSSQPTGDWETKALLLVFVGTLVVVVSFLAVFVLPSSLTPLERESASRKGGLELRIKDLQIDGENVRVTFVIEKRNEFALALKPPPPYLALDVLFWDSNERLLGKRETSQFIPRDRVRTLDRRVSENRSDRPYQSHFLIFPPKGARFIAIGLHADLVTHKVLLPRVQQ